MKKKAAPSVTTDSSTATESSETKENTQKWAQAKVKEPSTIDESEEHKEVKDENVVQPEDIANATAQFGYNELFHAAAEESSKEYDKTFE